MADKTITISSIVSYYNSGTNTENGTSSVTGYINSMGAKADAKNEAVNAANHIGAGTPSSGGSSSTSTLRFGSDYGGVSASYSNPGAAINPDEGNFDGWCVWSASRTSTMYQAKLSFTLPTGVTAANISSAKLTFKATPNDTSEYTFSICAPKSSNLTQFYKYSDTNSAIDTSKYVNFKRTGTASEQTFTDIDITNIFKQCITNKQGWIVIMIRRDTPEGTRYMTINNSSNNKPTITYTTSYTKCGAPTAVSSNVSIQKPNGTVSISWSGATAGDNNTISGYRVYYKTGSAPTISTTTYVDVSSSPYSFTIPSGATRGATYYFKVATKGSAGGDYQYSDISTAQATVKVNQLPGAPSITEITATRFKSTGGAVTFTISPGTDPDTGQTLQVWYNTDNTSWSGSNCKQVPSNGKLTTPILTATTTYYFRTWDGLEYSPNDNSGKISQEITKNTKPTIKSVSMTAYNNTTYQPTITIQNDGKSYVKNINGSVTVGSSSGSISKYYWKLQVWKRTSTSAEPVWSGGNSIGTTTSSTITNKDVTNYKATFGTAYRLAVIIEDDIGEQSTEAYSSTIFGIPPVPTITAIYNYNGGSNYSNTNPSHFNNGMRIVYSETNTGVTRTVEYDSGSTGYKFSNPRTVTSSYNSSSYYSSVSGVTSLPRGTTYYFRVKYTLSSNATYGITYATINSSYYYNSSYSTSSKGYTRSLDITPKNITVTKQNGTEIKPYTQSLLNFTFKNQPAAWKNENDVSTDYKSIYKMRFKYTPSGASTPNYFPTDSTKSLTIPSCSNSSTQVTGTIDLSSILTSNWQTLLGLSSAPNASYKIILEITAANTFGTTFPETTTTDNTATFTANFVEGIVSVGTPTLQIKTDSSTFTTIPSGYNYIENQSGKDVDNRYHIFEGQTLRLSLSGITCYANQMGNIYFMNGSTSLGSIAIAASDWTAPSGTSRIYTLKSAKTIEYVVPANTVRTYSSNVRNYSVKVTLANKNSKLSTDSDQSNGNLNTCFHMPFSPDSINFKITGVSDDEKSQTWSCTDWGGLSSGTRYSVGYSSIKVKSAYCTTATGTYTEGSYTTLKASSSASAPASSGSVSLVINKVTQDIIYLGSRVQVTLDYQPVVAPGSTATTPFPVNSQNSGSRTYTLGIKKNQFTYYRETPNLLYGKNFFVLNQNLPKDGRTNQLLEIFPAEYKSGSSILKRNTIYFGTDNTSKFVIDENGNLVVDCGSW